MLGVALLGLLVGCDGSADVAETEEPAAVTRSTLRVAISTEPDTPSAPSTSTMHTANTGTVTGTSASTGPTVDREVREQKRKDSEQKVAKVIDCLRKRGWDVNQGSDGGVAISLPADQGPVYQDDVKDCWEKWGPGLPDITEEYAGALYDKLLVLAECVRDAGFKVDEPPSRATFIERLMIKPIPMWHPYDHPAENGRLAAVRGVCPIDPIDG